VIKHNNVAKAVLLFCHLLATAFYFKTSKSLKKSHILQYVVWINVYISWTSPQTFFQSENPFRAMELEVLKCSNWFWHREIHDSCSTLLEWMKIQTWAFIHVQNEQALFFFFFFLFLSSFFNDDLLAADSIWQNNIFNLDFLDSPPPPFNIKNCYLNCSKPLHTAQNSVLFF